MIDLSTAVVNNLSSLAFASLVALSAALLSLPALCRAANRFGLVDRPSRRKIHGVSKPLVGGLGMAFAVFLSVVLCSDPAGMAGVLAGMLTIVVVGVLDDRRDLNHWWKFAAQVAAALVIVRWSGISLYTFGDLLSLGPIEFPRLSVPVTVFCIVGVANAFNMLDGMDGLAGGVSLIAFVSFACVSALNGQPALMLLCGAMSGALIGFLRYNWHPARLFMGDAGSLFLGFAAAFVSIAVTDGGQGAVRPVVPLLILAVPIADTLTVIFKRVCSGRSPFRADQDHLHHTLLGMGLDTRGSVSVILLISFLLASLAIAGMLFRIPEPHLFMAFSLYFFIHLGSSFYRESALGRKLPADVVKGMRTHGTTAIHKATPSTCKGPLVCHDREGDRPIPLPNSGLSSQLVTVAAAEEDLPKQDYVYEFTSKR